MLGDGVCSFTGWRVGKGLLLTHSAFCSPFEHPSLYPPSDSKPPISYSLAPACSSGLSQGQKTWMGWTAPSSLHTQPLLPRALLARLLPLEISRAKLDTDLGVRGTCQTPSSSHHWGRGDLHQTLVARVPQGFSCTSSSSSSPRAGFGSVALNIRPAWARPPASRSCRQSPAQAAGEETPPPHCPGLWHLPAPPVGRGTGHPAFGGRQSLPESVSRGWTLR